MIWVALSIVTPVLCFWVGFSLGRREGTEAEKYRWESRIKINTMPYSGLFFEDDPEEATKYPPMVIRHKKNGKWGPGNVQDSV